MKTVSFIKFLSVSILALMVGCGGGGDNGTGPNTGPGDTPEQTKMTKVQFVSSLSDAPVGSDWSAISNYFVNTLKKREGVGLAFVDRSDNEYGTLPMAAGVYGTAVSSRHFTCFALNRIVDKTKYQGTTVMLNRYMTDVHSFRLSDNACVTGALAELNVNDIANPANKSTMQTNFWTVRLTDATDVSQLAATLSEIKKINSRFIVVGTVKRSVLANLKSAVEGSYKFMSNAGTDSSDFLLFAFTDSPDWVVEAGAKVSLGGGIDAYEVIFKW